MRLHEVRENKNTLFQPTNNNSSVYTPIYASINRLSTRNYLENIFPRKPNDQCNDSIFRQYKEFSNRICERERLIITKYGEYNKKYQTEQQRQHNRTNKLVLEWISSELLEILLLLWIASHVTIATKDIFLLFYIPFAFIVVCVRKKRFSIFNISRKKHGGKVIDSYVEDLSWRIIDDLCG